MSKHSARSLTPPSGRRSIENVPAPSAGIGMNERVASEAAMDRTHDLLRSAIQMLGQDAKTRLAGRPGRPPEVKRLQAFAATVHEARQELEMLRAHPDYRHDRDALFRVAKAQIVAARDQKIRVLFHGMSSEDIHRTVVRLARKYLEDLVQAAGDCARKHGELRAIFLGLQRALSQILQGRKLRLFHLRIPVARARPEGAQRPTAEAIIAFLLAELGRSDDENKRDDTEEPS
jgi:hypothetical protein